MSSKISDRHLNYKVTVSGKISDRHLNYKVTVCVGVGSYKVMLVVRIDMFSFFKTNKLTCCGHTIVAIFKSLHNVEGFYTTSL